MHEGADLARCAPSCILQRPEACCGTPRGIRFRRSEENVSASASTPSVPSLTDGCQTAAPPFWQ